MKHTLIACGILILVLAFCIFSMTFIRSSAAKTLDALTVSYECARKQDCSSAAAALSRAEQTWKKREDFFSAVLAHDEVDQVATDLAQLREYIRIRDMDDYLATAASLMETIRHMRQVELPFYYNIL